MNFYLTTNTNRNEPDVLASISYVHIKGKSDGSQTVIMTHDPVSDPSLAELSQDGAQALLNSWVDEENLNPSFDSKGNPLVQSYINLSNFVVEGGIKAVLSEQSHLDRMMRGHATPEEIERTTHVHKMVDAYPHVMRSLTPAAREAEHERLIANMSRHRKEE